MSSSSGFSHISSQRSLSNSSENLPFLPLPPILLSPSHFNLGFSANLRPTKGNLTEKMADRKSLDLFPQEAGFGNSNDVDSRVYKSATAGPQTSQMTIFYAGQVFVFNNFPADRVGDVMFLASQESSRLNIPTAASVAARQPPILVGTPADSLSSTSPPELEIFHSNLISNDQIFPISAALPMARKASIQRFLEKRKDRLTPRAPYHNSSPMTSKNSGENSWLGLAVQSQN
ncbi:protein TIFY 10a [Cucumis melo var. makuwa]|uniref:Protein TIFY n=1 Tax=Cucumis melo var. makuwa TaxID=1194695 RepID=A0A5A7UL09_CUCMM|nr:protein TIFY 10a [Cucumis melo var. makuwa]